VQFVELAARAAGDRDALRTMGMRARDTALSLDWQRVVNDLKAAGAPQHRLNRLRAAVVAALEHLSLRRRALVAPR
jgi:hypothetical protein